jgi:hypothetical protein
MFSGIENLDLIDLFVFLPLHEQTEAFDCSGLNNRSNAGALANHVKVLNHVCPFRMIFLLTTGHFVRIHYLFGIVSQVLRITVPSRTKPEHLESAQLRIRARSSTTQLPDLISIFSGWVSGNVTHCERN